MQRRFLLEGYELDAESLHAPPRCIRGPEGRGDLGPDDLASDEAALRQISSDSLSRAQAVGRIGAEDVEENARVDRGDHS